MTTDEETRAETDDRPGIYATPDERAALNAMQQTYPQWSLWRTHTKGRARGWAATNVGCRGAVPTLHADTAGELEKQLARPPAALRRGR